MYPKSIKRTATATITALLFTGIFVSAQDQQPALKITRPSQQEKTYFRETAITELGRDIAFQRLNAASSLASPQREKLSRERNDEFSISTFGVTRASASAPTVLSLGTGGGDI